MFNNRFGNTNYYYSYGRRVEKTPFQLYIYSYSPVLKMGASRTLNHIQGWLRATFPSMLANDPLLRPSPPPLVKYELYQFCLISDE